MKIVFISSMQPSGHYSQYLAGALNQWPGADLIVYAEKDPKNLDIRNCGIVKAVWSKSPRYVWQILKELKKDRPDIIHLQHEINMYGGPLTALLFPFLMFFLRLLRYKFVVTIHAVAAKEIIDKSFIELFCKNPNIARPFFVRSFFTFVYRAIGLFASKIIVHTRLAKKNLVESYGTKAEKIEVITPLVPENFADNSKKENYFLYFGYMVRRKGLSFVLDGFKQFLRDHPRTDFKLVLAGGVIQGQEAAYEEIKNEIYALGLQNSIILKGFIEESEMPVLYQRAYAVVIPAKISISSSGPLYHAKSYGKFVIASRVGNFLEEIVHLKSGYLTDNEHWADAFCFAAGSPDEVRRMEKGIEMAAQAASPEKIAQQYVQIYGQS